MHVLTTNLAIIDRKTSFCHSRKPLALTQSKKQLTKRNLVVIMGKRSKKISSQQFLRLIVMKISLWHCEKKSSALANKSGTQKQESIAVGNVESRRYEFLCPAFNAKDTSFF
jgi:hypothetical protein